ncbi:MAG: hypothetical protein KAS32_20280 [Candidatus Peribacteraceae bacterium]|nr:hypothetical protein [Candidatus Peribacteraceae bacterium]
MSIIRGCEYASVRCVISSNADAKGLKYAKDHSIHTCVTNKDNPTVTEDLVYLIGKLGKPKMIVLAGYMKLLPTSYISFCKAHHIRIVNIHPSLLPKYKGLNTHERVFEAGDTEHGFTVHDVIDELDAGNIIYQHKFVVREEDTVETLTDTVKLREQLLYPSIIDDLVVQ